MSREAAQKQIIELASVARRYGAEDLQLGIIGDFDEAWLAFGAENSLSVIGESKERYMERLRANQATGENLNP